MNLKKVFLRNFKNYDKETLDLESSSFWILRGKNSSGKSTLACDALTYALFGKIKAMDDPQDTKISVDDIVKRGKTKATVRVEFTNKTDNYVIERIREIRKSSSRESVQIKKNGRIIHPKDAPKTKADQWIKDNLWSYKDFTNTTLIMQDEMTKALNLRKGERKDYLERLFGIKDFQEMGVISREKAKEILGDLAAEDKLIDDKKSRLLDKVELQNVKLKLENNKLVSEQNELDVKSKRSSKNTELQDLKSIETELKKVKDDIVQDQKTLNQIESQIKQKELNISELDKVIENRDQVKETLVNIEKIEKQIEDLKVIKKQVSNLEKLKNSLLQHIDNHEKNITNEIFAKSDEIERAQSEKTELKEELDELRTLEADKPKIENALKNEDKILKELADHKEDKINKSELQAKLGKKQNEKDIKIQAFLDQQLIKQNEIDKLADYQNDYDKKVKAKFEWQNRETTLKTHKLNLKTVRDELVSNNTTLQVLKNSILSKEKNLTDLEVEIKDISNIHDHATCPTCKQSISTNHVDEIVSDLEIRKKSLQKENINTINITQLLEKDIIEEKLKLDSLTEKESDIQTDIEDFRRASDGISASLTQLNTIKQFKKELQDFENAGGIDTQYPELTSDILELELQISGIIIDNDKLVQLENIKNDLIKKRVTLTNLNSQILKIESRENKIEEISDLIFRNKEVIENLELELAEEKYSAEQRIEISETNKEIEELNIELVAEQNLITFLIKLDPNTIRKNISEIQAAEKSKDGLFGELKGIKTHHIDLKKKINSNLIKTEEEKYREIDERVAQSQIDLEELEQLYKLSIQQKQKDESELIQHLQIITIQEALEEEINKFELIIKDKREDQDTYKHLEKIFQQIGGRILGRLRYQINVATIDILSLLGNIQLEGITLNEDFSITIQTPEGDERPSFFSGGQKVRIGFAFRLALSKVLAEFRGNELDTLIIDEGGFGALDEDGQEGVIDVFKSLQDRFERVIVISHIPKITNNLPGAQIQIKAGQITDRIN